MSTLSKRQFLIMFGFNQRHLNTLIDLKVVRVAMESSKILLEDSIQSLVEGDHYIKCQVCGSFVALISPRHLQACSGLSIGDYIKQYPLAPLMCVLTKTNKIKTEEQKIKQSHKLKERFKTPKGEITRQQISKHASEVQQAGYKIKAAEHLRKLNNDPERIIQRRLECKEKWKDPDYRTKIMTWREANPDKVGLQLQNARQKSIRSKFSKPHRVISGYLRELFPTQAIETEYPFERFSIDEAFPQHKLAIEIDGCYWHGCLSCGLPSKFGSSDRDNRKSLALKEKGWFLIRVKEHDIKNNNLENYIVKIKAIIKEASNGIP